MNKPMKSPTLALLEESGEAPTRENFLNLAFMGNPPSRLHPEEESELPAPFQTVHRELDKNLRENAKAKKEKAKTAQK